MEATDLVKEYRRGAQSITALGGVSFSIEPGSFVCVVGPSGSGKSTLLHLLGVLDEPTTGTIAIDGDDVSELDDEARSSFRRTRLGFVFQFFNLLPALTAWENVAVPWLLGGERLRDRRADAVALLDEVGLATWADHRPAELSGGQLQRVATARALACQPALVLADEPTGNLDRKTGAEVLDTLRTCGTSAARTLVLVTHDHDLTRDADRVIELVDGAIVRDTG